MIKYVNCLMGTRSQRRFSQGNTLPLVQLPFGFASFAPVTDGARGGWFFHPDDRLFEGIRLTHQPSPWIKDHGAVEFLPQYGEPELSRDARRSGFSEFRIDPFKMSCTLTRHRAKIALSPNEYGGSVRVDFSADDKKYISFLPVSGRYWFTWSSEKSTLFIKTDCMQCDGAGGDGFFAYFAVRFAKGAVSDDDILVQNGEEKKHGHFVFGENCGIHLAINALSADFSIAESYIGFSQAEENSEFEKNLLSLEAAEKNAEEKWRKVLGRIEITGDEELLSVFYSCLYRVFLFPHKAHEPHGGTYVHYSPADDTVKEGLRFTDCGFWDTYRTTFPLFGIIAREEYRKFAEGFVNDYKESGWLPRWTSMNYKNCMPSTMLDVVIAHGAAAGILPRELLKTAARGMVKQANEVSIHPAFGRAGCLEYKSLGYVPCDKYKESVNLTLDAAYCDWCAGTVLELLGEKTAAQEYFSRSKSYRNLFDKDRGFMVGKKADGTFREDFDPFAWGRDYTEAGAFQTSFSVVHDLEGLAALYGGKEEFLKKLDELFAAPSEFSVGGYGTEIHEMTEFAAEGFGQCAICNQPSFHLPFLYAYFGCTEKTEYWVRRICGEAFDKERFPGDEDNGSMAAWFVFAVLGMYPVCPGKNEFVRFRGLADSVRFNTV